MQNPDYLIITSTQTGVGKPVTKAAIIEQHTQSVALGGHGFNRPGYDYLVQPDGALETIIQEENPNEVDLWGFSDGVNGLNGKTKILAFVGGMDKKGTKPKDTRSEEQKETLASVIQFYVKRFPKIQVLGWDQIPAKKGQHNPAFDVSGWLQELGIPSENLFQTSENN